jgi:CRISPR-associated protein Cas1
VTNAVTKVGLNAQAGFLHAYQPGKPVLVYDLVEEFRAPAVDRPVFSMLNRREPFRQTEDGLLSEESRKKLAAGILSRLGAEVVHQGRRQTIREVLDHQAMAVRRYLLGQARYRPFHAKW